MNTTLIKELVRKGMGYGPAPESDTKVRDWLKGHDRRFSHFINGKWHPPSEGQYFESRNPANGELLANIGSGSVADVDAAMQAAERAFPKWQALPGHERAKYLYAMARAIAENQRLFAVLESLDNGKPIRESRDIDVPLVIRHLYHHIGWAELMADEFEHYRALGVIAQVIPWNFPLLMLIWKIAPALAAGNTVVIKPAEYTSLTALMFAEMLGEQVKLPPGVLNIVNGNGQTGELIVGHPIPRKVAFTGSTAVGREIRKATAGTGKYLTLELGGKSPFIVFEDADLDSAIESLVDAIFFNYGQVCCAGSRLLVKKSIADDFIARLKVRVAKLRGGKSLDKTMDFGALNSGEQLEKIRGLVAEGRADGVKVWQPEGWSCPEGCFGYPPTICTNVQPAHRLAQEEIFGPVLVIMTFRTPSEAVALANNTRYGLAASVWSQDIGVAMDVASRIKAGSVWINTTNVFDADAPFGGYRESGYGREGGREGMHAVMEEHYTASKPEPSGGEVATATSPNGMHHTRRFLIGGALKRPDGQSGISIVSTTGVHLGVVGDANPKDIRNAVEAARKGLPKWEMRTQYNRAQILDFLAENLTTHLERFAVTISLQTGRSLESARREVDQSIKRLFYWAAWADKFGGRVCPTMHGRMLVTAINEPIGVIGIRAPDEYPLLGVVSTLAPAFIMGNAVVQIAGKHSLTAMDLVQVLQNSDIPAASLNVLCAANPDAVAEVLAQHEDVDAIWFFGSSDGSRTVETASVGNIKRTWTSNGKPFDWRGRQGRAQRFLREATQVKTVWVPYGA